MNMQRNKTNIVNACMRHGPVEYMKWLKHAIHVWQYGIVLQANAYVIL
jgi:hypothetical protein